MLGTPLDTLFTRFFIVFVSTKGLNAEPPSYAVGDSTFIQSLVTTRLSRCHDDVLAVAVVEPPPNDIMSIDSLIYPSTPNQLSNVVDVGSSSIVTHNGLIKSWRQHGQDGCDRSQSPKQFEWNICVQYRPWLMASPSSIRAAWVSHVFQLALVLFCQTTEKLLTIVHQTNWADTKSIILIPFLFCWCCCFTFTSLIRLCHEHISQRTRDAASIDSKNFVPNPKETQTIHNHGSCYQQWYQHKQHIEEQESAASMVVHDWWLYCVFLGECFERCCRKLFCASCRVIHKKSVGLRQSGSTWRKRCQELVSDERHVGDSHHHFMSHVSMR